MRTHPNKHHPRKIFRDVLIIIVSIIAAMALAQTQVIETLLKITGGAYLLDSFMAGLFFTSVFTTPVAIVTLAGIAQTAPIFWVAVAGSVGALLGDLIIFMFIKNSLAEDISYILQLGRPHQFRFLFKFRIFRWLTFFLGALVIASPLPDELGLAMMGLSKVRTSIFVPFSLVMNFIGILIIGAIATSM